MKTLVGAAEPPEEPEPPTVYCITTMGSNVTANNVISVPAHYSWVWPGTPLNATYIVNWATLE